MFMQFSAKIAQIIGLWALTLWDCRPFPPLRPVWEILDPPVAEAPQTIAGLRNSVT